MDKNNYSKTELAVELYPHLTPESARNRLMYEIHGDRTLMRKLKRSGYRKSQKVFTMKQSALIREWL